MKKVGNTEQRNYVFKEIIFFFLSSERSNYFEMVVIRLEMIKIFEISTSSHLGYVQECYMIEHFSLSLYLFWLGVLTGL